MKHTLTIIALLLSFVAHATEPTREYHNINDGWRFYFANDLDNDNAHYITLPHTWNANDTGYEAEYKRTTANYLRTTWIPKEWQDRRIFLRFGGVQSVADVFVNGKHAGEHHGGYTAFTMEITDLVRYGEQNHLRVVVSNAMRNDVVPITSDQNLCGGIYRDVEIIVTPKSIVSPLFYSCDGVLIEQQTANKEQASGVAHIYLLTPENHLTVNLRVIDPSGYEVCYKSVKASKITPERSINIPYEISHPELWSPTNPTLYTVEVSIGDVNEPSDIVSFKTGFRTISISDDNKLCINNKPVDIHGVGLSHDRKGVATAITAADIDSDLALIKEVGANAIHSIGGPHIQYLYNECDKRGILTWVDSPFTRSPIGFSDICFYDTEAFRSNGIEQLKEIIYQNYNHPSVVTWGIFSLVWQRGSDLAPYIEQLNEVARSIDKSRPTVACSNNDGNINFITNLIVIRQDVGWEKGFVDDVAIWCEQLRTNDKWSTLHASICYGEEGISTHNSEIIERAKRGSHLLPARRQRTLHEGYIKQLEATNQFWGLWLNNMFDHGSSRRPYGLNHSGLVEYDHATKKDIFYLYKALWNEQEPTLHIVDKGWTMRHDKMQEIIVYSSCGKPELTINGENYELHELGRNVWSTQQIAIEGEVKVEAKVEAYSLSDSTTFTVLKR